MAVMPRLLFKQKPAAQEALSTHQHRNVHCVQFYLRGSHQNDRKVPIFSLHQALTLTDCTANGAATLTYDGTTLGYSGGKCVKPQRGGASPANNEELVIETGCSDAASTFHFAGTF